MRQHVASKASLIFSLCFLALTGCSDNNKNNAPDRNFYFEVIAPKEDKTSTELATYIQDQIPGKKYTITYHSGMAWPFYKELGLEEKISKDSLMPPHWFVHRMIPFNQDIEIEPEEFFVKIFINPKPDTIPNYKVETLRKDSSQLILFGQSGIHYFDSAEFGSSSIKEVFLKSIIRSSFK